MLYVSDSPVVKSPVHVHYPFLQQAMWKPRTSTVHRRLDNEYKPTKGVNNLRLAHGHTHARMHTHATVLRLSRLSQGQRGCEGTRKTFTCSHLSWSSIIHYLLPPYITIHDILCSIDVLDILFPWSLSKFSLVNLLAWRPLLHTPYISSPNHWHFFTVHAHTIATCFALILSSIFLILYASNPSGHSYLCPLKCHLILLSYGLGLTYMQHTTCNAPTISLSLYQWYILIGKHW